jgi:hypothetical protein
MHASLDDARAAAAERPQTLPSRHLFSAGLARSAGTPDASGRGPAGVLDRGEAAAKFTRLLALATDEC